MLNFVSYFSIYDLNRVAYLFSLTEFTRAWWSETSDMTSFHSLISEVTLPMELYSVS